MTQPELFEELQAQTPVMKRRAIKPVFAVRRFSGSFSAQQLALVAVGLILALVASFALGVERGRRVGSDGSRLEAAPVSSAAPPPSLLTHPTAGNATGPAPVTSLAVSRPAISAPNRPQAPAATAVKPAAAPTATRAASRQYTIQLATYTSRQEGDRELAKLQRAGYAAYLTEGHRRYALCVGAFSSRAAATKQRAVYKRKFHDCFVRIR